MADGDVLKIVGGEQAWGLAALAVAVTVTETLACDTTDTDATVLGNFTPLHVGYLVSGAGIPSGVTVVSVVANVSAEISSPATATASGVELRLTEPDPGAIGANVLWLRRDLLGFGLALAVRNESNEEWRPLGPSFYNDDGALVVQQVLNADGSIDIWADLGLDLNGSPVGTQAAAVADAVDETDIVAQFNALLAAMRASGELAT